MSLDQVSLEIGRLTESVDQLKDEVGSLRADVRALMHAKQHERGMRDLAKTVYGAVAGACGAVATLLISYLTSRGR
jgi:hypothetical protein